MEGDPLARTLRKRFKQQESWPSRKFKCVYSDELLQNKVPDSGQPQEPRGNGTIAHITAIFGFMLAALVLQHAVRAE